MSGETYRLVVDGKEVGRGSKHFCLQRAIANLYAEWKKWSEHRLKVAIDEDEVVFRPGVTIEKVEDGHD